MVPSRSKRGPLALVLTLAVGLVLVASGTPRASTPPVRARSTSPSGVHLAEVRGTHRHGDVVWVDGRPRWPDAKVRGRALEVASPIAWSRHGDALAFVATDRRRRASHLVVVLLDDAVPATLSWPIPREAQPARRVTWLGPSRVGAGPSELQPRITASWEVRR